MPTSSTSSRHFPCPPATPAHPGHFSASLPVRLSLFDPTHPRVASLSQVPIMASRIGARAFAPALRRVVHRRAEGVARRQFSSGTHGASNGSDTPWIIGSALVFVPTIIYLLSPSAQSNSHKAHSAAGHDEPHAHEKNAPKTPPPPEPTESEATIADAEGTEVPVEEVKASLAQAVTQDAPKEAAQAEAEAAESPKSDDGTPGQTSEAETNHEQSEKPHDGTPHGDEDAKLLPPDLSEAPEQSIQVKVSSL
ncbi:hypothetical protein EDB83DRAFT_2340249 [Lactarius deliciosus]|nr:hypothetical protein EDB83DRAFT_2340249 [Lactarius deliciosus]